MSVSKRIFGSDVDEKTKHKINKYQLEARGDINTLNSLGDIQSNFDGSGGLSSRTPFARMWTAIQTKMKIVDPEFKDISYVDWENTYGENPSSKSYYSTQNISQKVYALGTNDLSILRDSDGEFGTGIGDMTPPEGGIDNNEHFSIQPGITSVSSNSQGPLGLIRKTTVNFTVHNPHDFDYIYSKYFLRPGALLFVDFGWDTAFQNKSIYSPSSLLNQSQESGFDLEEILYSENGIIEKANGDMETVVGFVTNFSSTLNDIGLYECSVTISSKNSALIGSDFNSIQAKEDLFTTLDAEVVNVAAKLFGEEFLDDSKSYATVDIEDWNKYARLFAAQQLSTDSVKNIYLSKEVTKVGVYYWGNRRTTDYDLPDGDASKLFISLGMFEDLILNENLAVGNENGKCIVEQIQTTERILKMAIKVLGNNNDINSPNTKRFTAKFNSSNSFCRYDLNLKAAQKHGAYFEIPKFLYPTSWDDTYNTIRDLIPEDRIDQNGRYMDKVPDKLINTIDNYDSDVWTDYDINLNRIPIREIFISVQEIKDAFLGNDSTELAITQILNSINRDSHDILNLSLHTTNKSETEMAIIDRNMLEMTNPLSKQTSTNFFNNMLKFNPGSENSIIQNFNLSMDTPKSGLQNMIAIQSSSPETEIFPYDMDLASQISTYLLSIDADNPQIGFSYVPELNDDTVNKIKSSMEGMVQLGKLSANNSIFFDDDPEIQERLSDFKKNIRYSNRLKFDDAITRALDRANNLESDDGSDFETTTTTSKDIDYGPNYKKVSSVVEMYKYFAVNGFFGNNQLSPLVPFKLQLSIYGLHGLQTGDVFRIDYLPKRFKNIVYFQITKVNHRISTSGWTTEIESIMRTRSDASSIYQRKDTPKNSNMSKRQNTAPKKIVLDEPC